MSDLPSLLPPNSKSVELSLEQAQSSLVGVAAPMSTLWNPYTCPVNLLPYLAWAFSVDDWDPDWSVETKRSAVAASIPIHRIKGTVKSVRDALTAFGYGEAVVLEGFGAILHDGEFTYDGAEDYGAPDHWADYRVYMERPITIDQAGQLKSILKSVAPARCHLKGLFFTQAANRYNSAITYDGSFSHGVV